MSMKPQIDPRLRGKSTHPIFIHHFNTCMFHVTLDALIMMWIAHYFENLAGFPKFVFYLLTAALAVELIGGLIIILGCFVAELDHNVWIYKVEQPKDSNKSNNEKK